MSRSPISSILDIFLLLGQTHWWYFVLYFFFFSWLCFWLLFLNIPSCWIFFLVTFQSSLLLFRVSVCFLCVADIPPQVLDRIHLLVCEPFEVTNRLTSKSSSNLYLLQLLGIQSVRGSDSLSEESYCFGFCAMICAFLGLRAGSVRGCSYWAACWEHYCLHWRKQSAFGQDFSMWYVCARALYKHDCVQVCDPKCVWRPECQCQMLLYHSLLYFFEVNSLSETRV